MYAFMYMYIYMYNSMSLCVSREAQSHIGNRTWRFCIGDTSRKHLVLCLGQIAALAWDQNQPPVGKHTASAAKHGQGCAKWRRLRFECRPRLRCRRQKKCRHVCPELQSARATPASGQEPCWARGSWKKQRAECPKRADAEGWGQWQGERDCRPCYQMLLHQPHAYSEAWVAFPSPPHPDSAEIRL